MSILVLKNVQRHTWEDKMKKVALGIVTSICVTIFLVNVIAADLYLPTEWNFDYELTYQGNITAREYDFNGTIFGVLVYSQSD